MAVFRAELQPHIADVVELPFAGHRLVGLGDHGVSCQYIGQQGKVFVPRRGLETAVHRPGHQVGGSCRSPSRPQCGSEHSCPYSVLPQAVPGYIRFAYEYGGSPSALFLVIKHCLISNLKFWRFEIW